MRKFTKLVLLIDHFVMAEPDIQISPIIILSRYTTNASFTHPHPLGFSVLFWGVNKAVSDGS